MRLYNSFKESMKFINEIGEFKNLKFLTINVLYECGLHKTAFFD